jgi:hypothetical protein
VVEDLPVIHAEAPWQRTVYQEGRRLDHPGHDEAAVALQEGQAVEQHGIDPVGGLVEPRSRIVEP